MTYDQARTNCGNFIFWFDNPVPSKDKDSEFNMTARQTRIGANINYEILEDREVSGWFELDFYGGGAENKNMLMIGLIKLGGNKMEDVAGHLKNLW